MRFEDANEMLRPGYLPFESGYQELEDGKWVVAGLTRMPGCRAKMVDWWFSWLGDIDWYRLWHPRDHVYSAWENRVDGKYIGGSHLVHEYLAGKDGPLFKLRIDFHDPSETFDARLYKNSGALAVCARPGLLEAPIHTGRMTHFVRNTDYGCEMRSRFWLGLIAHRDPDGHTPGGPGARHARGTPERRIRAPPASALCRGDGLSRRDSSSSLSPRDPRRLVLGLRDFGLAVLANFAGKRQKGGKVNA